MTVTIQAGSPWELPQLMNDLRALAGPDTPVKRAVHGSGVVVPDGLALAWLQLTLDPDPEWLDSLLNLDPGTFDVVGRRAPAWALQNLARWREAQEANAAFLDSAQSVSIESEPINLAEPLAAPDPPAKKANKAEWELWAQQARGLSPEKTANMTRAQLQELVWDDKPGPGAPETAEEG